MTAKQVEAQAILIRALQQAYPEDYRFDEPYLPKSLLEQHGGFVLTGKWNGKTVHATVAETGFDNEFAVTLMIDKICKRETVDLNVAEEPLATP